MSPSLPSCPQSAGKYRLPLGLLSAALIATLGAADLRAEAPGLGIVPAPGCIQTPSEYMTAFQSCLPITCVSPNLYATTLVGEPDAQPDIYPSGFHWAWTVGSESLKTFADWRRPVCRDPGKGPALSNNILLYVGFSQGYIDSGVRGQELNLAVMDLHEDELLFVPTPAGWFEAFQRDFRLQIPLEAQKSLTLGLGGTGGPNYVPLDANQTFANITGCSLQGATGCSDEPLAACGASYRNMARTLAPFSPYGDSTTEQCVDAFKRRLGGRPADAAETRAMLYYCQDVNACNTGVGYGFNPTFPRAGGPAVTHFTGPEFVLLNRSRSSIGAVLTRLPTIPQ